MKVVLFLQNAWSPVYAGGEWDRMAWLKALERSRSGQRLKLLIDDFNVCWNTTPIVGATPSSIVPPDEVYIANILEMYCNLTLESFVVVTCGKQAENVLTEAWNGPMLALPHPAYRVVTNKLYTEARRMLDEGFSGRKVITQERGSIFIRDML